MSQIALTLEAQIKSLTERVTELESREAFHEYTVENLNQTIIRQQEILDRLMRVSQQLIDKVKEMPGSEEKAWSLEEEIPPHY
ncbi:MAG TPA: SlyX family protein [Candidatus Ignatzschineria merdigallinarum]|uniref:Protein SlyX homolog n=1 Tax=Candidatus Ignatzschineria merdigallinarum TaxID=2838621 RepID=A0A9D1Q828_9GAMM|nr:SlyX family protein [Candidatus Ignatzschineria merdigallinarum]